jgi:hypothetical protein
LHILKQIKTVHIAAGAKLAAWRLKLEACLNNDLTNVHCIQPPILTVAVNS